MIGGRPHDSVTGLVSPRASTAAPCNVAGGGDDSHNYVCDAADYTVEACGGRVSVVPRIGCRDNCITYTRLLSWYQL